MSKPKLTTDRSHPVNAREGSGNTPTKSAVASAPTVEEILQRASVRLQEAFPSDDAHNAETDGKAALDGGKGTVTWSVISGDTSTRLTRAEEE